MTRDPQPLAGRRLVTTVPAAHGEGYEGWSHRMALSMTRTLAELGADVMPFDTAVTWSGLDEQIAAIRAFKPDLVVGTPGGTVALICEVEGRNLFFDRLGLPTLFLWDALDQVINVVLAPHRDGLAGGVRDFLRARFDHPLAFHCVYDSGHVALLRSLGIVTSPNLRVALSAARDPYVAYGRAHPRADGYDEDVAFIGTLHAPDYVPDPVDASGFWRVAQGFRERVLAATVAPTQPVWPAITQAMQATPPHELVDAQLTVDHAFFWPFVSYGIFSRATMGGRQAMLRRLARPVSCYSLLDVPPESPVHQLGHLTVKPAVDPIDGLAPLNARTKVTVDLVTRNYVHGVTNKVVDCFAAGGLCLFDAKADFEAAFGSDAARVGYTDVDDLCAKVDYFLGHDRERRETVAHFQNRILAEHGYARDIAEAIAWVMDARAGAAT